MRKENNQRKGQKAVKFKSGIKNLHRGNYCRQKGGGERGG